MHLLKKAQITYLKVDEAFIEILSKYANFVDIFSLKLVIELSEHIRINDHTIKLVNN